MNKTWSIILIVVACIVVLGGTYWYVGAQKPLTDETTIEQPIQQQVPEKAKPAMQPSAAKETVQPEKQVPAVAENKASTPVSPQPAVKAKATAPVVTTTLPPPVAPIVKKGVFALPTLGENLQKEEAAPTPVLVEKVVPLQAEATIGQEVLPVLAEQTPAPSAEVEQAPLEMAGPVQEAEAAPIREEIPVIEPVQAEPIALAPVQMSTPLPPPPTAAKPLVYEEPTEKQASLDASISVSFLDYSFPKEFTPLDRGFNVQVSLLHQNESLGYGGVLEVGKVGTDQLQVSLLGKVSWSLGKGAVTFPLSISLGPTFFHDTTTNANGFGMKAKLTGGVTYAISDSFRIFYEVGVASTYNFKESTSFRLALEPIRVGVGFSF